MKTFKVVTLGCRTNRYESQAYQDQLLHAGYRQATEGEEASLCIVNTCTVTQAADASSRHAIRRLGRENPGSTLVVTGCSVEGQGEAIASLPGVSKVVFNKDKERLLPDLFPEEEFPEFAINQFDAQTRAFVKVQDGCNSFCTYCIIPYVRGRSRSRTLDEVVREVEGLVANGYKEVVLTGINVGDFDGGSEVKGEKTHTLADLVRAVDAIPGVERLRISSIDPDEVDDDLLQAVIGGKHTCHSMHIVLQSGSNLILKRMNRKYTRQIFYETVDRLLAHSPDFTFTTDVIVGFPGETEEDFQETLDVIRQVRFAKVHFFPYSARPRTRAATYPNQISAQVIAERKQRLARVCEEVAFNLRQGYVGRKMAILTEEGEEHETVGHTDNFLLVELPGQKLSRNQLVEVELIENRPEGLVGKLC